MDNLLWSEEEIKVSDGFLFVVDPKVSLPNEEQPFLLYRTVGLLQTLYPSINIQEVFQRDGFESEEIDKGGQGGASETSACNNSVSLDDIHGSNTIPLVDEEQKAGNGHADVKAGKSSNAIEYKQYQKLRRVENLANQINVTLQDIRNYRHRTNGTRSDSAGGNEDKCANARFEEDAEAIIIKLARTINSIRALFPHLLPILNHPRRNDKNLMIRKTRYKTKRNGPMCWLLGTESFGSCTLKQHFSARDDTKYILEAFIDFELASEISMDPKGSPLFWRTSWIKQISKRSNPALISPLKVLTMKTGVDEETIRFMACRCDKMICTRDEVATQRLDQNYKRAVRKIHQRLSNVLTSRFQGARLSIYGSCLSNLSLGKGSDVDMSLWIPAADTLKRGLLDGSVDAKLFEQSMKKFVYQVFHKLSNLKAEFRGMTPITKARIPVITGTYIYAGNPFSEDGSIDFDISFLNDIAVANSNLLRDYSLVDPRVRTLMITVKKWAKEHKITSAKEKCISSYSWMNLVVFYLQCVGFVPNFQSPALMKAAGLVPDHDGNYWHFVNNLDTFTLKWEEVRSGNLWTMPSDFADLTPSLLLYGFFEFYSLRFPYGTHAVSIKSGEISQSKLATTKVNSFLSIEDPFETYDSYCPHDLGTPANAYGLTKIRNCLRDAEEHLRMVLCSKKENEVRLWPDPPFVEPEPTRGNAKKLAFKHFERQMPVIHGKNDLKVENKKKTTKETTIDSTTNQFYDKRYQADSMARYRGSRRGRNDRAKAKKVQQTNRIDV